MTTIPDPYAGYVIEPLGNQKRAAFSCEHDALVRYLKQQATQDAKKYIAAPFVLVEESSGEVVGYYTLSPTGINLGDLPEEISKKLPKYPIVGATLIGRLAVDIKYRSRGLGERLLMDALHRSLTNEIVSMAVVVEPKDDKARSFYQHYEFICFPDNPNRLFLPMKSIAKLFK